MQSEYPAQFERDMGCTEVQWLTWLPAAVGNWPCTREGTVLRVDFSDQSNGLCSKGQLLITWRVLPPRIIALLHLPRLGVRFEFDGVDTAVRNAFMKRFDLHMQRGGG